MTKFPEKTGIDDLLKLVECPGIDHALISYIHKDAEKSNFNENNELPFKRKDSYRRLRTKYYKHYNQTKLFNIRIPYRTGTRTKDFKVKDSSKCSETQLVCPLNGDFQLPSNAPENMADFVVFAQQGRQVDNQFNGGKKIADGIHSRLVFKFIKL